MIYGIGHDLVDNRRIGKLLTQYGNKFIDKILSIEEKSIFIERTNKVQFVAKRFAAKEAFAKACGTGIIDPILLGNISILNDDMGKPVFYFASVLNEWLISRNITQCHISLTDEKHYSSAFVVLESMFSGNVQNNTF